MSPSDQLSVPDPMPPIGDYWIGLMDSDGSGSYYWLSGRDVSQFPYLSKQEQRPSETIASSPDK